MENKFKVGDKVIVKSREEIKNIKSKIYFDKDMVKFCGMLMEIDHIVEDKYIKLVGDVKQWSWDAKWLEFPLSRKERLKEEIKQKQRELSKIYEEESQKGYLDGVETWEEAIDKMKELNAKKWEGKFVLIDGNVYFNMCMGNDFFEDKGIPELLSEN